MMGMALSVYIGPYLKVFDLPDEKVDELLSKHQNLVCDGRGESGCKDEHVYLIPNQKLPGVSRQMSFDKYSEESEPFEIPAVSHECYRFGVLAKPVIEDIRAMECGCKECWGIVTGWF
jgi:hypothetical protein